MVYYTCTKCQTKIADTSLDRKKLDQQIWEHFCSFHAEEQELDALTIFRAYLKTQEWYQYFFVLSAENIASDLDVMVY